MPPKRPAKETVADVLKPIKALRAKMGSAAPAKKSLDEVGVSGVTKEVRNLQGAEVRSEIEAVVLRCVTSIMRGDGFSYSIPARTASNCVYVPELDRLVLKDKMLQRIFANSSSSRKTAITTRVLQLVMELCAKVNALYSAPRNWPRP
jgi:meiotic recombination protein SPO11